MKTTRWDIPLIGADRTNEALSLLSADLIGREFAKVLENTLKFDEWRRIYELRKSCGVTDKERTTVTVRRPPRYA